MPATQQSSAVAERANVSPARHIDVTNPATGKVFAQAPLHDLQDLESAISGARQALPGWSASLPERRQALANCASAVRQALDDLATLLVTEQGKPLRQAYSEIEYVVSVLEAHATMPMPDRPLGRSNQADVSLHFRPIGVAGLITPWNYPVGTAAVKLAPALLMGNTVVLKPSAHTPLTPLRLVEILRPHLPEGVVHILIGGDDLGQAMARHPGIGKLSVTGSLATGQRAMRDAAANLKRITLELGGNDPAIVLPDADPAACVPRIAEAAFRNAGQVCSAIKRLYLPRQLLPEFCQRLMEQAQSLRMGDGMDPATALGPLTHEGARRRIENLVADALDRGGRLLCGGRRPEGPGYFYPATLIANLHQGVSLVDEEQFGPVLPIIAYDHLDDAIDQANQTPYGLSASLWTSDPDRAARLAPRLHCGRVGINGHKRADVPAPFGGFKQSGLGRELGEWGLAAMGEIQVVNLFH